VALDISLNDQLVREGLARELVNRIQNLRKDLGLEVTDRIQVQLTADQNLKDSINDNLDYICSETLADELLIKTNEDITNGQQIELVTHISTNIELLKI
jgi:isoleucyl-tRNA synthetase